MRVREIIVEHYLIEVNLEKLATQPVKGGQTVGSAVAKKVAMNRSLHIDAEDHVGALEIIAGADPTPNNAYTRWLARIFIAPNSNFRVPEDIQQIKTDLEKYWKLAKTKKLKGPESNIDNFKSLGELYDVLEKFDDEDTQSGKEIKKQTKAKGGDFIINDPGFSIIHLKTKEAACFYGKGTKWCTAGDSGNMFNHYNSEGPLYVILVDQGGKQRKFQYHYESGSFMNERDESVGSSDIALLSKYPGWTKFLNMEIKKYYEPIYNEIKDII